MKNEAPNPDSHITSAFIIQMMIVTDRISRQTNNLVVTVNLFGYCLQGDMKSANELFSTKIIVEGKDMSIKSQIFGSRKV